MHATCPVHSILRDLVILIIFGVVYEVMKLLIVQSSPDFGHFLSGPFSLLSTLFSDIFLNVRDASLTCIQNSS